MYGSYGRTYFKIDNYFKLQIYIWSRKGFSNTVISLIKINLLVVLKITMAFCFNFEISWVKEINVTSRLILFNFYYYNGFHK